jgi:hypothetical protein
MQGASMSDSEKPAKIETASDSDFSAARAARWRAASHR